MRPKGWRFQNFAKTLYEPNTTTGCIRIPSRQTIGVQDLDQYSSSSDPDQFRAQKSRIRTTLVQIRLDSRPNPGVIQISGAPIWIRIHHPDYLLKNPESGKVWQACWICMLFMQYVESWSCLKAIRIARLHYDILQEWIILPVKRWKTRILYSSLRLEPKLM